MATTATQNVNPQDVENESDNGNPRQVRIDPITELQDGIDGLSLAMFEALRGLRDAVAPESGNLGNSNSNSQVEPDTDELWHLYRSGDEATIQAIHKAAKGSPFKVPVTKREDFVRLHAKMEMEKDTELVMKLASTVLEKSATIDQQVDALPGMNRTRNEQMQYIEALIEKNKVVAEELEQIYKVAKDRRDECRKFVMKSTCAALGIEEDIDSD